VAYFPEEDIDVRDALANIIDDLAMVKNIDGQFYIPARGSITCLLSVAGKGIRCR